MIGGAGQRRLGRWQGHVRMSADFDAALPDAELAVWTEDEVDAASQQRERVNETAVPATAAVTRTSR
jgi:hypothetical protein